MSNPTAEPDVVTLLVIGASAIFLGALGLVGRAIPFSRALTRAGIATVFGLVAFSAVAAGLDWPRYSWVTPLVWAGVCGGLTVAQSPAARSALARLSDWAETSSLHWRVLLLAGLALVLWYAHRAMSSSPAPANPVEDSPALRARAMASLRPELDWVALTDRGRQVRLFHMPESAISPQLLQTMEAEVIADFGRDLRLIRTLPADHRANCHGWIFAERRWWILGDDIDAVVQDNGYERVFEPRIGDLVMYREGANPATHTGVVFAAPKNGIVLVESKWGALGSYLHVPDVQPCGGFPEYYRSPRPGHRLNIVPSR